MKEKRRVHPRLTIKMTALFMVKVNKIVIIQNSVQRKAKRRRKKS